MNRSRFLLVLICAACVLPYAAVYLLNLWGISHYQFFPLLLGAVGYIAYTRWSEEDAGLADRVFSRFALAGGVCVAAAATLFASTWMAYLALVCFVAALLSRVQDRENPTVSLAYLALPLLLIWQPPYSPNVTGDGVLIARLQNVSASFSSRTLDLFGVLHQCPGTVIRCAGKSFGVEEACSGVQSFFSLLCFASLIVVFYRRGWLHTVGLIAASVFWAIIMNTVRITLIPIAYLSIGFDLSHGLAHTIVGLATMTFGLLLLVSTDRLLTVVPAVSFIDQWIANVLASINRYDRSSKLRWDKVALFGLAPLMLGMGGLQFYDIASSWGKQKSAIDFFSDNVLVDIFEADGPAVVGKWERAGYRHEDRVRGADFGERSDVWFYRSPVGDVTLSLDQAFPGWHELPVCYTNIGWKLVERRVVDEAGWPVVVATFRNTAGEHGVLLFSMFDEAGEPVAAPSNWGSWNAMKARVRNRLSPSVRGTLFSLAAYQVQVFVQSPSELSTGFLDELFAGFRQARDEVRDVAVRSM